jgi:hypothetical protein
MIQDKKPFVLSEIGSVFGVKKQKSIFGFLNEKKGMYFLESSFIEIKLDFTYCRNSYGYIMKGSFVAATGVLKGTKFVVFEIVVPQSGFFLESRLKQRIFDRYFIFILTPDKKKSNWKSISLVLLSKWFMKSRIWW